MIEPLDSDNRPMEPTDMRWLNPLNHQAMEGRHGSSGSSVDGGAGGGAGGHGGGVPRLVLSDGRSVTIYERHNNKDTTFKDKAKKGINPTKVAKHNINPTKVAKYNINPTKVAKHNINPTKFR